jgi:hypothetical protein
MFNLRFKEHDYGVAVQVRGCGEMYYVAQAGRGGTPLSRDRLDHDLFV